MSDLFRLASYARHRPWCPEDRGPADCTCGLYALLDSIRCGACGHSVRRHTDRDVSDVVGWPCNECRSGACRGFVASLPAVEAVLEANHRGNVAALLDYRRGVSDGQVQALRLDVKAIKDEVRNLAYLTREEWAERRGGDPIARTINAVFDILDARLAPARDDTSGPLPGGNG